MRATQINLPRKICMLVVSIIILFSQGCNKSRSTPSPTQTLSPTATEPRPADPTATEILPTARVALPTSIPFGELMPEGALARLNLGAVEQIALSPTGDRLVAAGATHVCLYDMASYEKIWCTAASLQYLRHSLINESMHVSDEFS